METIFLGNKAQVILFEAELKGQLSDGNWENATPHDHWKVPSSAEVVVGYEPHLTFRPSRGYKFHDKDLFEAVSQRMIFYVKFYQAFPQLDLQDHHSYEFAEGAEELRKSALGKPGYWSQKVEKIEKATRMTLEEVQAQLDSIEYTPRQCRSDLRKISLVFKLARKS